MVKLKSIKITGFKEQDRVVDLKFSDEPATVIYGQNGSGKTTLLRIIHAVFTHNIDYLARQNISEIQLVYSQKKKQKELNISFDYKAAKDVISNFPLAEIPQCSSILFGVNRGVISDIFNVNEVLRILNDYETQLKVRSTGLYQFKDYATKINNNSNLSWIDKNHIRVDSIDIEQIKKIITKEYQKGLNIRFDKISNAFIETISNAVDIEMEQTSYNLPDDFEERIQTKKEILVNFIKLLDESSLQKKLLDYLQNKEANSEIQDSKIFRALLVNILEKAEEENIELKAINTLTECFNSHLYRNKKLIITENEAYIQFVNGQLGPRHDLEKLSSGERHLLTLLTLFLIIGRGRDFFIIDEPEISMNMKWQRQLIPLLTELSPNSQIIVATHSPDIASRNSNYLVELV